MILIVSFNSCTIEKRSYQPGYYVDWHNFNRKSNPNPEVLSELEQQPVCQGKLREENSVDKIEDFNQPEVIQGIEPVFSSSDESLNNVELINFTNQKKTVSSNIRKEELESYGSLIKEKTIKSSETIHTHRKVHWAAILGLILCIIGLGFGLLIILDFIPSLGFLIFCMLYSTIFINAGGFFSLIALYVILKNPEEYRGIWLIIANLIIVMFFWGYYILLIV
ncbi:MAG: hypothetical protein PHC47_03920 [Clostridia bacterium]|nr:hypothetical protein [Clostridia bacterium]